MFPIILARQVFANPGWHFGSPAGVKGPSLSFGSDIQRFDAPKIEPLPQDVKLRHKTETSFFDAIQ
jgi:hypothetical protein